MKHPDSHISLDPGPAAAPGPEGASAPPRLAAAAAAARIGVPVSIWPQTPEPDGPDPGAGQIIASFSRPGDLVVLPCGQAGVFLAAAARASRRAVGLVPGPAERHTVLASLDPALRPLAEIRSGGPGVLLDAGSAEAGQAALAITSGPAGNPGLLYAACQRVLRPGGVLAVITTREPSSGKLRDRPGEVITGARAAGLVYAQHIVVMHATIRDGQLAPDPASGRAPLSEAAGPVSVHARIHSDLLVFTKPGGTPR